jgi:hypothetical protein
MKLKRKKQPVRNITWWNAKPLQRCLIAASLEGEIKLVFGKPEVVCGWNAEDLLGKSLVETVIPQRYRMLHQYGLDRFQDTGEAPAIGHTIAIEAVNPAGKEFPIWLTVYGFDEHTGLLFGVLEVRE